MGTIAVINKADFKVSRINTAMVVPGLSPSMEDVLCLQELAWKPMVDK